MTRSPSTAGLTTREEVSPRAAVAGRNIYDHALELFEKNGFHNTSMNEIAKACGVTKPTLYYYFRDKSHLLETLYAEVTREFFGQIGALARSKKSAEEKLRELVHTQVLYNIDHRRFLTIFWNERAHFSPESRTQLAKLERDYEHTVQSIIDEGVGSGAFRKGDTRMMTFALLGLISTVHRWARHTACKPKEIAEAIADIVLQGVLARRAIPTGLKTARRPTVVGAEQR